MIKTSLTLKGSVKLAKGLPRTEISAILQAGRMGDHAARCEHTRVVPPWLHNFGRLELYQKSAMIKL